MVDTATPDGELDRTLPEACLEGFSSEQVQFAVQAWPLRAAEEARSQAVFEEMVRVGELDGVDQVLLHRLRHASADEAFHADLCTRVGARLGASPPVLDRALVDARLSTLPEGRRRLMALLVVEVAVGETLSCALFREGMQRATEPLTRFALTSILRDEATHAQLGWSLASELSPTLAEDDLEFLRSEVRLQLGNLEQVMALPSLRALDEGRAFDPRLESLGVLAPEVRVSAFYEALERRALPRLEALGLDGQRAWARRYTR